MECLQFSNFWETTFFLILSLFYNLSHFSKEGFICRSIPTPINIFLTLFCMIFVLNTFELSDIVYIFNHFTTLKKEYLILQLLSKDKLVALIKLSPHFQCLQMHGRSRKSPSRLSKIPTCPYQIFPQKSPHFAKLSPLSVAAEPGKHNCIPKIFKIQ